MTLTRRRKRTTWTTRVAWMVLWLFAVYSAGHLAYGLWTLLPDFTGRFVSYRTMVEGQRVEAWGLNIEGRGGAALAALGVVAIVVAMVLAVRSRGIIRIAALLAMMMWAGLWTVSLGHVAWLSGEWVFFCPWLAPSVFALLAAGTLLVPVKHP